MNDDTAAEAAQWMLSELSKNRFLDQAHAATELEKRFGSECVYINTAGNVAIAKTVLRAFGEITPTNVVWDRAERSWRYREPGDSAGRQV